MRRINAQTRSTKRSTTRFPPALSKAMVSLLPSTATTLPSVNQSSQLRGKRFFVAVKAAHDRR